MPSRQQSPVSAAVAMPTFSSLGLELGQRIEGGRVDAEARRKSSRLSRRPSLSASSSTRWALRRWACRRASGSSAPRTTDRSGSFWKMALSAHPHAGRSASWACSLAPV
jgi:hypothetical protein